MLISFNLLFILLTSTLKLQNKIKIKLFCEAVINVQCLSYILSPLQKNILTLVKEWKISQKCEILMYYLY